MRYSTVASLHIALDTRIQQVNSNRKQAIAPEQYDLALNDAILTVLKQRLSSQLSARQGGYEDSITAYDNIKSLKRTCRPLVYLENGKWTFDLPSDYYMYNSLQCNILYNRSRIDTWQTEIITSYVTVIDFSKYIFNKESLVYKIGITFVKPLDIYLTAASKKSNFYYFDLICEWFKSEKGIDCYYENYNNSYYKGSLIFVTPIIGNIITGVYLENNTVSPIALITATQTINNLNCFKDTAIGTLKPNVDMGSKKVDLISSLNDTNETNDFYLHQNNHLNPKCVMENNKVILTSDFTFAYTLPRFNYVKTPRLIDSRIEQMTDLSTTDDILELATNNLMRMLNIRDPYGEAEAKQQKQPNNQQ